MKLYTFQIEDDGSRKREEIREIAFKDAEKEESFQGTWKEGWKLKEITVNVANDGTYLYLFEVHGTYDQDKIRNLYPMKVKGQARITAIDLTEGSVTLEDSGQIYEIMVINRGPLKNLSIGDDMELVLARREGLNVE